MSKISVSITISESEAYTTKEIALARLETVAPWERIRRSLDDALDDVRDRIESQVRAEDAVRREKAESLND